MRIINEQFSQLASSTGELDTFLSQLEVNPNSHASFFSRVNSSKTVRKVNAIISIRSSREIDNQVENSKKSYKYPDNFFQNSPSSSLKTSSSS